MPEYPRVVAIALLTQSELDLLGKNFRRAFPINNTSGFEDILRAIDEADRRLHDDEPPE